MQSRQLILAEKVEMEFGERIKLAFKKFKLALNKFESYYNV